MHRAAGMENFVSMLPHLATAFLLAACCGRQGTGNLDHRLVARPASPYINTCSPSARGNGLVVIYSTNPCSYTIDWMIFLIAAQTHSPRLFVGVDSLLVGVRVCGLRVSTVFPRVALGRL